jgi:hypothetical protein
MERGHALSRGNIRQMRVEAEASKLDGLAPGNDVYEAKKRNDT